MTPGRSVAEVGGAIAAIEAAAPVAIAWPQRLSAVASGAADPELGDALDAYAAGLSASDPAREGTPSFHLDANPEEG
ncbi:MAG: hypothetical protein WD096_02505 [Actinomycetota bacterium]